MAFTLTLRGARLRADTLADLSAQYCAARDRSGEGASTWPTPTIRDTDRPARLRFSYNGRVWDQDGALIYDNRT